MMTDKETILVDQLTEILRVSSNGEIIRLARDALIDADAHNLPCMFRFQDEFPEHIRKNALEFAIQEHAMEWFAGHEGFLDRFIRDMEQVLRIHMKRSVEENDLDARLNAQENKISRAA